MRDWKLATPSIFRYPMDNLKPTYEGLKAERDGWSLSSVLHLKPTYEGLKDINWRRLKSQHYKFKAYLWGIERTLFGVNRLYTTYHLKPTYEGLKVWRTSLFHIAWWYLKPTYEGLKVEKETFEPTRVVDLKPTYEGLKGGLRQLQVRSIRGFKAYLWGIESVTSWTFSLSSISDLKPTYEGLKDWLIPNT